MRAVNLIPQDLRKGTPAGRTGGAVYVVLGALAVAVALVAAWTLAGAQVTAKKNELVRVQAETDAAERRAGELEPYAKFASMADKRVETVTSLSRSRFNWPFALREVSRVLPSDVWLVGVTGTVAPGVQLESGGGGGSTQLRSQLLAPALEMSGCSTSQDSVARYLARLRSVQGVTRVSLSESIKLDVTADQAGGGSSGSGGAGGGSSEDCRQGNGRVPKFGVIVFFEGSTATASSSGGPGAVAPTSTSSAQGGSK